MPPILSTLAKKQITQEIAIYWLKSKNNSVNWNKFLAYAEEMLLRTYENIPVNTNIIIAKATGGLHDITDQAIQKMIDPLSSSMQTFLKVDYEAKLITYDEITWSKVTDTKDYKFNPEFLQPFASVLDTTEISFHVTAKGDIIIMDSLGLLASYRKGLWHIYDVQTLKNSIGDIAGNYRIGCNIFELLWDLSYKRHGALLIFDPEHKVVEHIVNEDSRLSDSKNDIRNMLVNSGKNIRMGLESMTDRKKRVMLELASLDGAVLFDTKRLLAYGAMIETHKSAGNQSGARTTAFESAFQYGGKPFKVSSDGDISVRFGDGEKSLHSYNHLHKDYSSLNTTMCL